MSETNNPPTISHSEAQYTVRDKTKEMQFVVESIFSETSTQTLSEILLRLIQSDP